MEKIFSKTSRYSTESVQTENLGIASPVPMGSWNKAIMYQKLNYVRHNQATYLAKKSNTNFEPGVATNWEEVWMLFNYDGGSVSPESKEFYDYVRTEGTVLFSFNPDFSPAARYGGSWENITDRFLVGAGGSYALDSTGGEANVTLTVDEIPPHDHVPNVYNIEMDAPSGELVVAPAKVNASPNINGFPTQNAGGGQPHNNLPPYIACNIWRKVA